MKQIFINKVLIHNLKNKHISHNKLHKRVKNMDNRNINTITLQKIFLQTLDVLQLILNKICKAHTEIVILL